jgi:hypothetical protein
MTFPAIKSNKKARCRATDSCALGSAQQNGRFAPLISGVHHLPANPDTIQPHTNGLARNKAFDPNFVAKFNDRVLGGSFWRFGSELPCVRVR